MTGVGKITAVGKGVQGLALNDLVYPKGSFGDFRQAVNVSAASVIKVPKDIPLEYAGLMNAPLTAMQLLKDVKPGQVVIQTGADTLVGQAVVQMARFKGIYTVNVVQVSTDEEEMVGMLKNLGGDIVTDSDFITSWKFGALLSDVPKAALTIHHADTFEDATVPAKFAAAGKSFSKLKAILETATPQDIQKLKMAAALADLPADARKSYGPLAAAGADKWLATAPDAEVKAAVEGVGEMVKRMELSLWVENYPMEDFEYLSRAVKGPFPGWRAFVLKFCTGEQLLTFGDKGNDYYSAFPHDLPRKFGLR